jgi:hypothetical protein
MGDGWITIVAVAVIVYLALVLAKRRRLLYVPCR